MRGTLGGAPVAPPARTAAAGAQARAPRAGAPAPLPDVTPLNDDEIVATQAFKVLSQFKTCKDIRVSIAGEYWRNLPEHRGKRLTRPHKRRGPLLFVARSAGKVKTDTSRSTR
jgi:hypothetical protein